MTTETTSYNQEEVQELFDVVFKLSAKDINDKLTKVRNRPEIAKRRWFWELLQNAKDAVKPDQKVDVTLKLSRQENGQLTVQFSHNGNPFRYQDAKNLIFPYSDKEDEENSDKSGRFGTGFLATHILSKTIHVKGVYLKDSTPYDFEFTLDRSASDKTELANSINQTWQDFRRTRIEKTGYSYNQSRFDTIFTYPITADSLEFVQESIKDFQTSLPFALAFIPKVRSVKIEDDINNKRIDYRKNDDKTQTIAEGMKEIIIDKCQTPSDGQKFEDEINLILCSNDKVDIGIELEKLGDKTTLKRFPEHHPILFCPFPLIGANDFPFPIIINSESFIPKEERDGIWLEDTIEGRVNHEVFEQAVELFKLLTKEISRSGWKNTFLLFRTLKDSPQVPDLDKKWYDEKIQAPIKEFVTTVPLIDNSVKGRISIIEETRKVRFPTNSEEAIRELMWDLMNEIMPHLLPPKEEVHSWYEVLWDDCPKVSLRKLAKFISGKKNVQTLSQLFENDEQKTIQWLDKVVTLISKEQESLLGEAETAILPNQFGEFKDKDELYLDDDSIDEELKEIHATTGKFKKGIIDWRTELLDKRIYLELPQNKTRTLEGIALLIVENVKELLRNDQPNNELQDLFSKLLNWLNENPDKRREHFKGLKTDTLLYKTANEAKLKQFTELLRKDREGEISVEDLANLDPSKVALLNDPNLELKIRLGEQALEEMLREKEEFEFKKVTGDLFEKLFQQTINADDRFEIQKVEGEEDFIVTKKSNSEQFYIELKSIRPNEQQVQMTHKQAKKAHRFPSNYFLCFIPNNGATIDENYFRNHARFDGKVGIKLTDKVNKALTFEASENGVSVEFEDVLLKQYKKYRYKFLISRQQLEQDTIETFKNRLLN
ncbi:MAG: ATP-binding protein [Flavobacteriales bacterium]|nr:ATP-binding protein [Flavobacteriales bacterium]